MAKCYLVHQMPCVLSAFKQNPWFLTDFPLDEARCADWTFLPIHPGRKSQKYSDLIQRQFRICAPIFLLSVIPGYFPQLGPLFHHAQESSTMYILCLVV